MLVTGRKVVAAILFLVAMGALSFGNECVRETILELNSARPNGPFLGYYGFRHAKLSRVFREYRGLFPERKLRARARLAYAIGIFAVVGTAISLGFLG